MGIRKLGNRKCSFLIESERFLCHIESTFSAEVSDY